jgi:membrane protease YdiL (CAAX protease family)
MTPLLASAAAHPVRTYLLFTFLLSWGGALLVIGTGGQMRGTTPASDPRFPYVLIAMLAGPAIAGLLMTAMAHGRQAVREIRARLLAWRAGPVRFAIALLTAPVAMAGTLLVLSAISPAFVPGIVTTDAKVSLIIVSVAVGLAAGIVEELGWTGFAVPAMRRRYSTGATGALLGICWSAWHLLPNIWARRAAAGELTDSGFLALTGAAVVVGYLTAFRILMVRLYEVTGSLSLAMLMHASLTTSLLVLNPEGLAGMNLQVYSFALAGVLWIAVGVAAARGGVA